MKKHSLKRLVCIAALSLGTVLLFAPKTYSLAFNDQMASQHNGYHILTSFDELWATGMYEDIDFDKTFTVKGVQYKTVSKEKFKEEVNSAVTSNTGSPALVPGVIPLTDGQYVVLGTDEYFDTGTGWDKVSIHNFRSISQSSMTKEIGYLNKFLGDVSDETFKKEDAYIRGADACNYMVDVAESVSHLYQGDMVVQMYGVRLGRVEACERALYLGMYIKERAGGGIDPSKVPAGENTGPFRSWIAGKDIAYLKTNPLTKQLDETPQPKNTVVTKVSTAEKWLGEVTVALGAKISDGLSGNGAINASTMGVILGKPAFGVNYFVFDLTDKNIYGVAGAVIYYVVRIVCMTLIFIIVLWTIIKTLWMSTQGRGLSELKSVIYSSIIVIILMFIMPQIIDWVCNARDAISVALYQAMTDNTVGGSSTGIATSIAGGLLQNPASIETAYYVHYLNSGQRLADAIVYLAICIIPIFYIVSYVKIALQQLILFGLFPVFAITSIRNKTIMTGWLSTIISNCFIPTIDTILILVPLIIKNAIDVATGSGDGFASAVIVIVAMIGAIPVRNMILRMFGNVFGVSMMGGGEGFAAIAGLTGMAMAGARGFASSLSGLSSGKGGIAGTDKLTKDDIKNSDRDLGEAGKSLATETKALSDWKNSLTTAEKSETSQGDKGAEIKPIDGVNGAPRDPSDTTNGVETPEGVINPNGDNAPGPYEGFGNPDQPIDVNSIENPPETLEEPEGPEGGPVDLPDGDESVGGTVPDLPESGGGTEGDSKPDEQTGDGGDGIRTADIDNAPLEGGDSKPAENGESGPNSKADQYLDGNTADSMRATTVTAAATMAGNAALNEEIGKRLDHEFGAQKSVSDNAASSKNPFVRSSAAKAAEVEAARKSKEEVYQHRAANLQNLDNLRANQQRLDDSSSAAKVNISDARSRIAQNNVEMQQHKNVLNAAKMGTGDISMYSPNDIKEAREEVARLNKDNLVQNKAIADNERVIARNESVKKQEQSEIKHRQDVEQRYAKAFEQAGMSGQKHDSVEGFRQAIAHENRKADNVNFKNFNTKENQEFLTKRETERYQAQYRARVTAGKYVGAIGGAVAGGVATTVVAGVATGAAAFGGEQAMNTVMTGFANNVGSVMKGSAYAGSKAGEGIGRGAGAVKDKVASRTTVALKNSDDSKKDISDSKTSGTSSSTKSNNNGNALNRDQQSRVDSSTHYSENVGRTSGSSPTNGAPKPSPSPSMGGSQKPGKPSGVGKGGGSGKPRRNSDPAATGSNPDLRNHINNKDKK